MSGKQNKRRRRDERHGQDTSQRRDNRQGRDRLSDQASAADRAYQARVSAILGGQHAPVGIHGVRVLWRCPTCGKPWLSDASAPHGARLMLPDDELARLAGELGADLATLPYATCRTCGALHSIGELNIDQYGGMIAGGVGISWEGAEPPGAHILLTLLSEQWARAQRGTPPRAGIVTDVVRWRAVLRWLLTLAAPTTYRALDMADSAAMAADNPPGHGAPGTDGWVWRGGMWRAACPAWPDGDTFVTLTQAMPPREPYSVLASVATMRALARHLTRGHIASEPDGLDAPDEGGEL